MWEHGVPDSRVIVIEEASKNLSKPKLAYWRCKCLCGNKDEFVVDGKMLRSGNTLSCGCVRKEHHPQKHGGCHTKLYMVWMAMRKRCYNPNDVDYPRYGGRGILVCKEWNDDYSSFNCWAHSNGYTDGLEIDRIDNDGNYEPSNCRWITHKEQYNNRSTNIWIEYNGERKRLLDLCDMSGLDHRVVYSRYRNGWSAEEIIGTPYKTKRKG